jgi:hypothetical protein
MRELHRLYYLAVDLKPRLPDRKLLDLLPKTWGRLIQSAVDDGTGSGLASQAQLDDFYMKGAESGIKPTLKEFKGLLCTVIRENLREKEKELSNADATRLYGLLHRFYTYDDSKRPEKWMSFNAKAPDLVTFSSCFPPLDDIIRAGVKNEPGVFTEIITMLGFTGTGKSVLTLAIGKEWNHGSVWYFDPEVGEGLTLYRLNVMETLHDPSKMVVFGDYDIDEVLQRCIDDPDPNRLLIFDSLHAICGDGDTSDSRQMYANYYKKFSKMKDYVKLIIVTTQIKRGDDGKNLHSAAGSRNIENWSGALVSAHQGGIIAGPNNEPYNEVKLYGIKNRMGQKNRECDFVFDYVRNRYIGLLKEFLEDTPI